MEREEFEAMMQRKFDKWNTKFEGRPLNEIARAWISRDPVAALAVDTFTKISDGHARMFRDVLAMISDGPYFPGNHKDFPRLPRGLACTMCPAFYGIAEQDGDIMTVKCEWPNGVDRVKMKIDPEKRGGAFELEGYCRWSYPISPNPIILPR